MKRFILIAIIVFPFLVLAAWCYWGFTKHPTPLTNPDSHATSQANPPTNQIATPPGKP